VLGAGGIVGALGIAFFGRRDMMTFWLGLAAALLVGVGLVITVLVHFPINAQILSWTPEAPPPDWRQVADRWRDANLIRSAGAIAAFVLLVIPAAIRGRAA
jgi:uncharacterized membrane protein